MGAGSINDDNDRDRVRLWSLHPRYLDAAGLVALWREGLLAQKVLQGNTRGYRNHPQLHRFRESADPEGAIAAYLWAVFDESLRRGYRFDSRKIAGKRGRRKLKVTEGQMAFEGTHLKGKLRKRTPLLVNSLTDVTVPESHPLFCIQKGPIEPWERTGEPAGPFPGSCRCSPFFLNP